MCWILLLIVSLILWLLAEAGRDARFIASACQMREEDAEWLIRRLNVENRS
ncbi:hypothetical protein [Acidithiobacillus sulfurivorans]|uniref:Uncharacterized protein n=1 Tax=Acidithiobacillus sulfurivorans TaxID=1958756 RepID=A0ABS5ZXT8_9PROT|nr:hypothetical protein [Acidithiobacillus sulfurivorans]MBU2760052.1 hypothetical protein [Acidithiobacillus sulfurivorans]